MGAELRLERFSEEQRMDVDDRDGDRPQDDLEKLNV